VCTIVVAWPYSACLRQRLPPRSGLTRTLGRMKQAEPITPSASPPNLLRVVVGTTCAIWLVLAVRLSYFLDWSPIGLGIASVLVWLAVGLWQMRSWARSVSKFLLAALIVLNLLATFGPFYGLDHPASSYGGTSPWLRVLSVQIPLLAAALLLFGVLDRYKNHFHSRAPARNDAA